MANQSFRELNAQLNLWGNEGQVQFDKDKEAVRDYFTNEQFGVNANTVFFHTLQEKTDYLIEHGYWDEKVVRRYGQEGLKRLMQRAYAHKFRFQTFVGAYKFYTSYALKTYEGDRFLERFEDRVVLTAVAYSEDEDHAGRLIDHIIEGRFQPATPTFLNAGRAFGGEPTSCFLLRVDDNMESIARAQTDALQLSKRGGGVAFSLSNVRESGAPIQGVKGQSSGVVPIMKILEDSFSYANQLGARQGAGAVYLHAHHPDILKFLDTKRENADEKIRIKTLSLGVIIPDITFELLRTNEPMLLFSPYDIETHYGLAMTDFSMTDMYRTFEADDRIGRTSISARDLMRTIAEIQFESGYPYIMFEDAANRANPAPNVGRIQMSNLCSEIFQPQQRSTFHPDGGHLDTGRDIACNLGSLNVAKMRAAHRHTFISTVRDAIWFLTNVSERGDFSCSPTINKGNREAHAVGLGHMNLHGHLIEQGIPYDSPEAVKEWRTYIQEVTIDAILASIEIAAKRGQTFVGYKGSDWENGKMIDRIIEDCEKHGYGNTSRAEWEMLKDSVQKYGMYNQNLQAVPPTGSISYINNSTSSIHPIASKIEIRKEGKIGRVYYPAYGLTNENFDEVKTAYEMGPNPIIDMYAASSPYVDQGQSLTLFFPSTATTRDLNRAQNYAHKSGVKSLYYVRIQQAALEGTQVEECVSCQL